MEQFFIQLPFQFFFRIVLLFDSERKKINIESSSMKAPIYNSYIVDNDEAILF